MKITNLKIMIKINKFMRQNSKLNARKILLLKKYLYKCILIERSYQHFNIFLMQHYLLHL